MKRLSDIESDREYRAGWFTCQHHKRQCYLVCMPCLMQAKHHLSDVPMTRTMYNEKPKHIVRHTVITVELNRGGQGPEVGGGV